MLGGLGGGAFGGGAFGGGAFGGGAFGGGALGGGALGGGGLAPGAGGVAGRHSSRSREPRTMSFGSNPHASRRRNAASTAFAGSSIFDRMRFASDGSAFRLRAFHHSGMRRVAISSSVTT